MTLSTPLFQTFSLQNGEMINFYCFKLLGCWSFGQHLWETDTTSHSSKSPSAPGKWTQEKHCQFKVSLDYLVNSRPACITKQDLDSKNLKKNPAEVVPLCNPSPHTLSCLLGFCICIFFNLKSLCLSLLQAANLTSFFKVQLRYHFLQEALPDLPSSLLPWVPLYISFLWHLFNARPLSDHDYASSVGLWPKSQRAHSSLVSTKDQYRIIHQNQNSATFLINSFVVVCLLHCLSPVRRALRQIWQNANICSLHRVETWVSYNFLCFSEGLKYFMIKMFSTLKAERNGLSWDTPSTQEQSCYWKRHMRFKIHARNIRRIQPTSVFGNIS